MKKILMIVLILFVTSSLVFSQKDVVTKDTKETVRTVSKDFTISRVFLAKDGQIVSELVKNNSDDYVTKSVDMSVMSNPGYLYGTFFFYCACDGCPNYGTPMMPGSGTGWLWQVLGYQYCYGCFHSGSNPNHTTLIIFIEEA